METIPLAVAGAFLIRPKRHTDARGYLAETYNAGALAALGVPQAWPLDLEAFSARAGTVRGLHFQAPPWAQAKLVRVVQGAVFDAIYDLRADSPTCGRAAWAQLTATAGEILFAPAGVAHGYCTLQDNCLVAYKASAPYAPSQERGLSWADPALGIPWPVDPAAAILSEKDRMLGPLSDVDLQRGSAK